MKRQLAKVNAVGTTYESEVYTIVYDDKRNINPYVVYRTERNRKDGWKEHHKKLTAFADYKSCLYFVGEALGIVKL